jgi:hypothetical protein
VVGGGIVGDGVIGVPGAGRPGTVAPPGFVVAPGVPTAEVTMPAVQSTLVDPGVAIELPRKPTACARGLPLVFASPRYTRTTTRFMLAMLVSK